MTSAVVLVHATGMAIEGKGLKFLLLCCVTKQIRFGFVRFAALAESNPNFHPMISIGGWNSGSEKYSAMASDPVNRRIFVDSTVQFCKE